jgi:Rad3-related DNA helicase
MQPVPKSLLNDIVQWSKHAYGPDFTFRKSQLETIFDIVETFFRGERNLYLLDAPTGSGKSIIAMTVAGFLTSYQMRGYILASDLSLQTQYETDFRDNNLPWGSIKGVDNYTCVVNGEKFSLGDCRLKNISYEEAENLICWRECGYLTNRKRAIQSPVTLLNYSYWLIQRNYVESQMIDKGKGVPFPKRDFTICDEAHKLPEIVQNHFSPRLTPETGSRLEELYSFLKRKSLKFPPITPSAVKLQIKNVIQENREAQMFARLKDLESSLADYASCGAEMKETVHSLFPGEKEVTKEWRFALSLADWAKDMHCKFEDYNHIISQVGTEFMVKNPQGPGSYVFNCLEEKYMMNKYFHEQAGFKLLMTATMGDPKDFLSAIGGKRCKHRRIESTFDFQRSPIFFYPEKRMSMAQREQNFEWLKDTVQSIMQKHSDSAGIIHSGSYEISSRLVEALPPDMQKRIVFYSNSQEKEDAMKKFLLEENRVLIGPSLLEGINLFEERSRFQIFVKVPFPSLGDKFVSAKMNYKPEWYDWKTVTAILQGVGRSVRSEKDWAVTYFLDGCLSDLFRRRRKAFPEEFQSRIRLVKTT